MPLIHPFPGNPAFNTSIPSYPETEALPPGTLPGWATAVIVIGAVLFVMVTLIAIAGPRRLGACLLGDAPSPQYPDDKGPVTGDFLTGPSEASRSVKPSQSQGRLLLPKLLLAGDSSSNGVELDAAMEEGALPRGTNQSGKGGSKTVST